MHQQSILQLAGLQTIAVGTATHDQTVIVLLHGHAMQPSDLSPFAHSLHLPALFLFPQGPVSGAQQGHAWWPVDTVAKAKALLESGPRDLFDRKPEGLIQARAQLDAFLATVRTQFHPKRLVLGGFSQGGILSFDWTLHASTSIDALVLLSACRINFDERQTQATHLDDLRILISHGRQDADLAFMGGERLRDFLSAAGASVTWIAFDGGHEVPLIVWRRLRRFLQNL